jgi:hypothetical protein
MRCICFFLLFFYTSGQAQPQLKDYQLTTKGDTINRIDVKDRKHGRWIIRVEDNMGEPGFQEEGSFKDDQKEGEWKIYSLMGDPVGEEVYKYGQKSGKQLYFDIHGNLMREENWRAITPDNAYDTVQAPDWKKDPTGNTFKMVVIKLEGNAVKHGKWLFYDEQSRMVRTDEYVLDKLKESTQITYNYKTGKLETKEKTLYDIETGKVVASGAYQRPAVVEKPKVVQDFEKTKKGKKKKFQDGTTG